MKVLQQPLTKEALAGLPKLVKLAVTKEPEIQRAKGKRSGKWLPKMKPA